VSLESSFNSFSLMTVEAIWEAPSHLGLQTSRFSTKASFSSWLFMYRIVRVTNCGIHLFHDELSGSFVFGDCEGDVVDSVDDQVFPLDRQSHGILAGSAIEPVCQALVGSVPSEPLKGVIPKLAEEAGRAVVILAEVTGMPFGAFDQ
jgi:hypothetical protein